jgi:hypothetical protein
MLEWLDLDAGWPGGVPPEGVNHVAFGVASMQNAKELGRSSTSATSVRIRRLLRADTSVVSG